MVGKADDEKSSESRTEPNGKKGGKANAGGRRRIGVKYETKLG